MTAYVDSSFLVSLYARDVHSAAARASMRLNLSVWFSPLRSAEFCHAITQQVFLGRISSAVADSVYDDLRRDRHTRVWLETPLPEHAFDRCADLGRRYGPKLGVRRLDSLHVACALELKADRFWTFDDRQAKMAKAQGLNISK